MTQNIVEIDNLSFGYNKSNLLHKGITMSFPRGKVVAIMGGSGSGKTTLLRLIGGQFKPNAGEVRVDGQVVHKQDREGVYLLRRKMGMLFQQGALFTDLSVFENVAFPMRELTDLPENMIHDLVLMKLNAVGLRGAHHMMPTELSGGMARRVAIARAIALDPDVIMYDEPFAGLDPISMSVTCHLIRTLNDALVPLLSLLRTMLRKHFRLLIIFILSQMALLLLRVRQMICANRHYLSSTSLCMARLMVLSLFTMRRRTIKKIC